MKIPASFLLGILSGLPSAWGHLRARGLKEPTLEITANNWSPASTFPLQECQGDCDDDEDCIYGLVCLQRSSGDVSGCSGTPAYGKDYCVQPDEAQLVLMGNNGSSAENIFATGLGECEGDCDDDSDCQPGLKCFFRDDESPVPGCSGSGSNGSDYCYQPLTITYVGNNNELEECEGDCDTDRDCQFGLVCYQRWDEAVPGCEGTPAVGTDYCVQPQVVNQLVIMGQNGSPAEAFEPGLGLCEGDCDGDSDCQAGLKCFFRDDESPVPGCSGSGSSGSDYCYQPLTITYVGNNDELDWNKLRECEGECDTDRDCQFGLVCYQRWDEAVPGCEGTPEVSTDYCVQPQVVNQLVIMGQNGSPAEAFEPGLGLCEGDCDGDSDCEAGLKCFFRDDKSPVPGCSGSGSDGSDYCYRPLRITYVGNNNELDWNQLGECEGDCDTDRDCQFGLVCYQRWDEAVPGCEGTPAVGTDYCVEPQEVNRLVITGQNGSPAEAFDPGLGICEGDCDGDSDCQIGLKCFQRDDTEPVPGCVGDGVSANDYCFLRSILNKMGNMNFQPHTLGLCQGDCDSDEHCKHGLVCFDRSSDMLEVPECEGTVEGSTDYCTYPWLDNQLVLLGEITTDLLGVCQGDCDEDSDCELGLICDLRFDDETVIGCQGDGMDEKDYCIVPPPNWLVKVGNDGSPSSKFPLEMCEGDCDSDDECQADLVCRYRNGYEVIMGCEGWGSSGVDYCGPVPTPGATRVVAIGDVHGDVHAARNALKLAGVIDDDDHWIGGTTNIVQLGDQTDRGDTEREILDWFETLIVESEAAGGAFYPLIGNHEIMNVEQQFGYVTPGGWAEFADVPYDQNDPLVMSYPPAQRGRVEAFKPGGLYAKKIAFHPVILTLEGSLFVHGGVLPAHLGYGIQTINTEISDWLRGADVTPPSTYYLEDEMHPMWNRHYSDEPDDDDCALLQEVLDRTGMNRMVVAHTIQWDDGIHSACDGKIWKVDVGLSSYYESSRLVDPQILEIVDGIISIIRG